MSRSAREITKSLTPAPTGSGLLFGDKRLDPGFVSTSGFGNWVLVKEMEFDNEIVGESVAWAGNERARIIVDGEAGADTLTVGFNGDVAANYTYQENWGTSVLNTGSNAQSYYTTGLTAIPLIADDRWSDTSQYHGEAVLDLAVGKERSVQFDAALYYPASTYHGTIRTVSFWNNTADVVESIDIVSGRAFTGKIGVYCWQELQPVEMHTYELIKKLILNNESVNYSFDVEDGDEITVRTRVTTDVSDDSWMCIRCNDDANASSYRNDYHYAGNNTHSASTMGKAGLAIASTSSNSVVADSVFNVFVKHGMQTITRTEHVLNSHQLHSLCGTWNNTIDPLRSLRIVTDAHLTGTICIYKLVKTHLLTDKPGLMNGLWQKSTDGVSITVMPGEIEIGGHICRNASEQVITLPTHINDGETIVDDTYYYLYAVKNGVDVGFVFSTMPPTADRYGNVGDYAGDGAKRLIEADSNQSLHPEDGNTSWRYIGQVLTVDAAGTVLPFAKCRPGYWEGIWETFSAAFNDGKLIAHACGYTPQKPVELAFANGDMVCPWTNYVSLPSGTYGVMHVGLNTDRTIRVASGRVGVYNDTTWRTSGSHKLTISK